MDNLPFDPQIIIFIVFLALGFLKNVLEKGKGRQDTSQFPTEEETRPRRKSRAPRNSPLGDFKRMIEDVQRKATEFKESRLQPEEEFFTDFEEAPSLEEHSVPDHVEDIEIQPQSADLSLANLLRSPESARQAIILNEVLGKPKGL